MLSSIKLFIFTLALGCISSLQVTKSSVKWRSAIPLFAQEPVSISDDAKRGYMSLLPKISLLASVAGGLAVAQRANAEAYTQLAEPTKEFKDEQDLVKAFNAEQAKIRKDWDAVMVRLEKEEDSEALAGIIKEMTNFLIAMKGIPTGVKKVEIVKACRIKKYVKGGKKLDKIKPSWTTPCEINYQAFIQEFNRRVLPDNSVAKTTF
jgi:hypothetical protein